MKHWLNRLKEMGFEVGKIKNLSDHESVIVNECDDQTVTYTHIKYRHTLHGKVYWKTFISEWNHDG